MLTYPLSNFLQDEHSLEHVLSISHQLSLYLKSVRNISSVFSYLNKFYVAYYLNADLYLQLGGLFNQIIIKQRLPRLMSKYGENNKE